MRKSYACKRYYYYALCSVGMYVVFEFNMDIVFIMESAHTNIPEIWPVSHRATFQRMVLSMVTGYTEVQLHILSNMYVHIVDIASYVNIYIFW